MYMVIIIVVAVRKAPMSVALCARPCAMTRQLSVGNWSLRNGRLDHGNLFDKTGTITENRMRVLSRLRWAEADHGTTAGAPAEGSPLVFSIKAVNSTANLERKTRMVVRGQLTEGPCSSASGTRARLSPFVPNIRRCKFTSARTQADDDGGRVPGSPVCPGQGAEWLSSAAAASTPPPNKTPSFETLWPG